MSHVRTQIRDQLCETLTNLLSTRMKVSASRVYPHADSKIPSLVIYIVSDVAEPDMEIMEGTQIRQIEVHVEGRAKTATDMDDLLDDMETEVSAAIYADRTLGGLAKDIVFRASEIEFSGEAEQPAGVIDMTYLAWYRIDPADSETVVS